MPRQGPPRPGPARASPGPARATTPRPGEGQGRLMSEKYSFFMRAVYQADLLAVFVSRFVVKSVDRFANMSYDPLTQSYSVPSTSRVRTHCVGKMVHQQNAPFDDLVNDGMMRNGQRTGTGYRSKLAHSVAQMMHQSEMRPQASMYEMQVRAAPRSIGMVPTGPSKYQFQE